jgi:propanediol utilization protein
VDVRIGVSDIARELVVNSAATPEEIESLVTAAFKDPKSTLTLVDEKGKRILIPAAKVAYVEIAQADSRRVGFMVSS